MVNKVIISLVCLFLVSCFLEFPVYASENFTVGNPNEALFGGKVIGFGAEFDPFFFFPQNTSRGVTEADWQIITQRVKDLKIPVVRMMMQLGWATRDPNLNTWNWDNPLMKSVFRYLDFACQNNIDVILTDWAWTARKSEGFQLGLYDNPTDPRYGQGVAKYLDEFINKRGYTCIKYLITGNEPDIEIILSNGKSLDQGFPVYKTMVTNVDAALKANGMRSKIKYIGIDGGGFSDVFQRGTVELNNIFDMWDLHRYPAAAEISNINMDRNDPWWALWHWLDDFRGFVLTNDTNGENKRMFMAEMGVGGGNTQGNNDITTFNYALSMADYGTTVLTTRFQGGSAWQMFDQYYGADANYETGYTDESMMGWGMWDYKTNNWQIRPWAQAWGLLTRFAVPGSVQAKINDHPRDAIDQKPLPPVSPYRLAAIKRPDGGWNLFMVNHQTAATDFVVTLPDNNLHQFVKYQFLPTTTAQIPNTVVIPPSGNFSGQQTLTINLPAQSFTVLAENSNLLTDIATLRNLLSGSANIFTYNTIVSSYGK